MKTSDFYFEIPNRLIAQDPAPDRGSARMMILNRESGQIQEAHINNLSHYIEPRTVVVLNDTRVRKARLYGTTKKTGGRVEFLLLEEQQPGLWKTLVSKAKKQKPGKAFIFPGSVDGTIIKASENFRYLKFDPPIDNAYLESHGHMPLPPYIKREDNQEDQKRYQTIYARYLGSAAAPTAGLHITEGILKSLKDSGNTVVTITLHVGVGTFLPIRSRNIEEHTMHEEKYCIPEQTARAVNRALHGGRRILAVGTTVVRALESSVKDNRLLPGKRITDIFIYPGYRFRIVSQLLTNFHTPASTLLVLVSAFAGRERILSAYGEAVRKGYRFFSYGDAMLIR